MSRTIAQSRRAALLPLPLALLVSAAMCGGAMAAAPSPNVGGKFGATVNWPIIPIHAVLLPDGRVLNYGTDQNGSQGAQFVYDVWNPSLGTGANAHLVLSNTTGTDIFCSAQVVVPADNSVLITGGDVTIDGMRNYSTQDITNFNYSTNQLSPNANKLSQRRWYPSVLTLSNADVLVIGGRADPQTPVPTPQVYTPGSGWRDLLGATSDAAYGNNNTLYPRAWQAPNGKVFVLPSDGSSYYMDPVGAGSIAKTALTVPYGHPYLPSVMYSPGRILSIREGGNTQLINLTGTAPTATAQAPLAQNRYHANATVLADGKVLVSGGSAADNVATNVAYQVALWNPKNNTWTNGAIATQMRLYHSVAMLLPDATVLTAGGGAPGPVNNLNAEIYSPPYLFTSSGALAARPTLSSTPGYVSWGKTFTARVSGSSIFFSPTISRATLVKTGTVTHTVDFDQRFIELSFRQSGGQLTLTAPANGRTAPPGNYMLFVFNSSGVPSVAKVVRLGV
jgi:Domain of unknown function (DUF1929)/Glyoxal oxidase N-terminus